MATQESLDLAQTLYIAYYGRPADATGQQFWADQIDANNGDASAVINAFGTSEEFTSRFGELDQEALISNLYEQMFGRPAEPDGLDYYTNLLASGESTLAEIALDIANGAQGDDATALNNKAAAAQQFTDAAGNSYRGDAAANYAADFLSGVDETTDVDALDVTSVVVDIPAPEEEPEEPEEPGIPGETFNLTDGRDTFTGTDNDDTFVGTVGQNQNGALSNAFSTGDVLDGGAGRDKIEATMINDGIVDNWDNATSPRPNTQNIEEVYIEALDDEVTLDATRMSNVEEYWADFGRGNMTFNNVSLQGDNLSITKDVTFGIRDTQFDTDFTALFDSQSLTREAASQVNSSLLVRIADVSTETPTTPLANVDLNLSFDLGDETVSLEGVRSTDGTYPGLALALRNALEEAGYGDVNVNLSTPYSEVTVAGNTVTLPFTAQEILLTDPAGNEFSNVNFTQSAIEPVADGFLVAGNAQPQDPSSTSNLIESNLVLDNAGRGSTAGDVLIGGGSNSNKGVEQFNVLVDRDSKIASLNTTTDGSTASTSTLQNIVISSTGVAGSLYIGATQADLAEIDANDFEGAELSLGEGTEVLNLANLDAGGTSADVTFVADYDGAVRASNAQSFVINTGSGDDTITADLTGTSTSGSTTASLTINAGAGDNTITLSSTDAEVNEATVITAGGADTVTGGATHLTAETGAGNDVIYAENTGDKTIAETAAGVFATAVGTSALNGSTVDNIQLLGGRQVQVTLGLPEMVAAQFVNGLEVTAEVVASNGELTTERDLYEAVAKAINEDAVLNKLAEASVDSNGDLSINYLIDGVSTAGDSIVEIEVLGAFADLTTAQQNNLRDAVQAEYSNSAIADISTAYDAAAATITADVTTAGTDSLVDGGVNVVNGGAGDDVIVLSSDDATTDVVEFDAGQFGNDTIVHFEAGDVLNFSAWLNNVTSASGSTDSQVSAAVALNDTGAGTLTANDVAVVNFGALTTGAATFSDISNGQMLTALNAAFDVASTTDLVGNEQRSIVMVQNDDNEGFYNVYQVTSSNTAGPDFVGATLVGSVDFGEEQAFALANFDFNAIA